jgi:hypothetical protein
METLAKVVLAIVFTVLCVFLGLIPEIGMWLLWGAVAPVTELAKVILIVAFVFGGAGLSVIFAMGAFSLWALCMAFIAEEL